MELGLIINLVFMGFYTILLIAVSIDEARREKKREQYRQSQKLERVA